MFRKRIKIDLEKYPALKLQSAEYFLLLSYDASDIFRFFARSDFNGLNIDDCLKRQKEGGTYIDGWANVSPIEGLPPYVYLNATALNESPLEKALGLIAHEVKHLIQILEPRDNDEVEENKAELLEAIFIEIYEVLGYPKNLYYKIDVWKL
jgi:hypothetical protein